MNINIKLHIDNQTKFTWCATTDSEDILNQIFDIVTDNLIADVRIQTVAGYYFIVISGTLQGGAIDNPTTPKEQIDQIKAQLNQIVNN